MDGKWRLCYKNAYQVICKLSLSLFIINDVGLLITFWCNFCSATKFLFETQQNFTDDFSYCEVGILLVLFVSDTPRLVAIAVSYVGRLGRRKADRRDAGVQRSLARITEIDDLTE